MLEKVLKLFEEKLWRLRDLEHMSNLSNNQYNKDVFEVLNYWNDIVKAELKDRLSNLNDDIKEKTDDIVDLYKQLKSMKKQIEVLDEKNAEYRKSSEMHDEMVEKEKSIYRMSLKEELEEELGEKYKQKEREHEKYLNEKWEQEKARLEQIKEKIIQEYEGKITALSESLGSLRNEVTHLTEESVMLHHGIEEKKDMVSKEDHESRLNELMLQYEDKMKYIETQIRREYEQKEELQKEENAGKTAEYEEQIRRRDETIEKLRAEITDIINENTIRREELVAEYEKKISDVNAGAIGKEDDLKKEKEEIVSRKEGELLMLGDKIRSLESSLKQSSEENADLRERLDRQRRAGKAANYIDVLKRAVLPLGAVIVSAAVVVFVVRSRPATRETPPVAKVNTAAVEKEIILDTIEQEHREAAQKKKEQPAPVKKEEKKEPVSRAQVKKEEQPVIAAQKKKETVKEKSAAVPEQKKPAAPPAEKSVKSEKAPEQHVYGLSYRNPVAITCDGKNLWTCDWMEQSVYKHSVDKDLPLIQKYYFEDKQLVCLAWAGNGLWSIDSLTFMINFHLLDAKLTVKDYYLYEGVNPTGLFYDGKYLWVSDMDESKIYKLELSGGGMKIVSEYPVKGSGLIGVFWDGKNIWSADKNAKELYKHNMDSSLSVAETYGFPSDIDPTADISCVGWDGKSVWIGEKNKPYLLRFYLDQFRKK
ncbi:MAG: hypothetical protein JXJ19_02570 [Elusimicrobia bacterium]|nr:hypothetical protein [Elusimicrobiota bacterium]